MVISGHREHAAMLCGAEGIGVFDHIHAAIHAGTLAIPHAKHAVVARALEQLGLLTAPNSGCCEFLVNPGLEVHIVLIQEGRRVPQGLVDAAQGGAPVTRYEPCGIEPSLLVSLVLQYGETDQSLNARHVGAGGVEGIFVCQPHVSQRFALVLAHDLCLTRTRRRHIAPITRYFLSYY